MLWKVLHFHWVNVILAACFALRGHDTHRFTVVWLFIIGRICPLILAHFVWPLLKSKAFYYCWIRVPIFSKVPSGSWFSLVHECNLFCNAVSRWAQLVSFLCSAVFFKCSLNWSYIDLLWRIELWLSKLQLSVFLKIVWVFWLERVVPPLVIALNKLNSL